MLQTVEELNEFVKGYKKYIPKLDRMWRGVKAVTVTNVDAPVSQRTAIVYDIIERMLFDSLEEIKRLSINEEEIGESQLNPLVATLSILYLKLLNNNDMLCTVDNQLELPFEDIDE